MPCVWCFYKEFSLQRNTTIYSRSSLCSLKSVTMGKSFSVIMFSSKQSKPFDIKTTYHAHLATVSKSKISKTLFSQLYLFVYLIYFLGNLNNPQDVVYSLLTHCSENKIICIEFKSTEIYTIHKTYVWYMIDMYICVYISIYYIKYICKDHLFQLSLLKLMAEHQLTLLRVLRGCYNELTSLSPSLVFL